LFVIFAGTTLLWISLHRAPPNWDDAWYLTNSLTVYDALTQHGVLGYLRKLNSVFGFKAPLIAALPTPFYLLFGRRWHAAYLVNIAAMLVLFAAVDRIARRSRSPRCGVFAIAITGAMPLLYGLARYALAALVAAAIAILMEAGSLDRRRLAVLFGTICGFGLLLKAAFVLFLLPPFLYIWMGSRRRLRSLLLCGAPCLIVALPWYLGHLRATLANAFDAGFGLPATVQGTGAIFSVSAITTYLGRVAGSGVSIYYTILAAGLVLWAALRRVLRPRVPRLLFFWLLPFAIFLFGGNKDVRYIAPILPAFALLIAFFLDSVLPRSIAANAGGALLVAFPIVQMFAVSFGTPYRASDLTYARRFNPRDWSHDEILRVIAARNPRRSITRPLLLVGADRDTLNANNIELTSVALQLPLDVETIAHEQDLNTLIDRLQQASFFVYEDGGVPESPVFNPNSATIIQDLHRGGLFSEIPYAPRMPDGGVVRLFQRSMGTPNALESVPEEFVIDFGGVLALTGEVVVKTPDFATVQYRWRGMQFIGREYWSFTHLVDQAGRIVAQLDQPLPITESGIYGLQEIRLRLPAEAPASALRLRIGIYDPSSGDRLSIAPLAPNAASRFTRADQNTALITSY
jgi:hypothetical protein